MCVNLCAYIHSHHPMAVNFYLEKRTDKKGDAPIRISICIRSTRYVTSTGYKITPSKWDAAKQQVKKGCSNAAGMSWTAINAMLAKMSERFTAIENECILNNRIPDIESLKSEFTSAFGRRRQKPIEDESTFLNFWDYYKMFIDDRSVANQWTIATRRKFNTLKEHICSWRRKVSFDDFTEEGLVSFVTHLRDKKRLKNTSISKDLGFLKWFMRWATAKGYNTNNAFLTFSPKLKSASKQVVFLDWNELMKIFNYKVPANGTEVKLRDTNGKEYTKVVHDAAAITKTRDIFCFCAFTSLRYSDASNLKRHNISNGSITITTVKTADTVTIELNKYAKSVLDKYADCDFGEYALPPITNQRMNIYIKDLCELCEINQMITHTYYRGNERIDETYPKYELIGTHTGRRTFICNALSLGIPADIVMKWTGHADYRSMKPYIDIVNSAKAKAMSLFDKL